MSKLNKNQIQGVFLLIALLLLLVKIPFIDGKSIAVFIVLGSAIFNFIRK